MSRKLSIIFLICASSFAHAATSGGITIVTKDTHQKGKLQERVFIWKDAVIEHNEHYDRLVILGGHVDFYGDANEVVVVGGNVVLHTGSHIQERLVILGGSLRQEEGAKINGDQVVFEAPGDFPIILKWIAPHIGPAISVSTHALFFAMRFIFFWVLGIIFYLLFPKYMKQAEENFVHRTGRAVLWIFLSYILFFPGLLILVLSILGIALIPLYIMLYGFLFMAGYLLLAHWVGLHMPIPKRPNSNLAILFLGVFMLSLLGYIPVVGTLVIFVASMIASGAVLATFRDRLR